MMKMLTIAASALALMTGAALADPIGKYKLQGSMGDKPYSGTVEVVRTGETYAVKWSVGGKDFVGTAIGARLGEDGITMGPATEEDRGLSIGYVSDSNFGIAMFFEQADGTWQGVWTYGAGQTVGGETWTRE